MKMRTRGKLLLAAIVVMTPGAAWPEDDFCRQLVAKIRAEATRSTVLENIAMGAAGTLCPEIVPPLVEILLAEDGMTRSFSAMALNTALEEGAAMRKAGRDHLLAIVAAKKRLSAKPVAATDMSAAGNLQGALGRLGAESVPHLVGDLKHSDRQFRWNAALVLTEVASAAALPELRAALKVEKDETVIAALKAAIAASGGN